MSRRTAMTAWMALTALLLAGCASVPQPVDPIPTPVREALKAQGLLAESLAFVAFPLEDAQNASARRAWQADLPVRPASTMKVLTGIVALDRLGPNWRGRVELLAGGAVKDGVLDGPLVLRGLAHAAFDWGALSTLLREARDGGLREVRGGLLIDRTHFRPAREDVGLPPFDEAPEFPYNVIPDALLLGGNLLQLQMQSDARQLQARWNPSWSGLTVDASKMQIDPTLRCAQWEEGWKPAAVVADARAVTVRLNGRFPADCRHVQALQLIDRSVLAAQAVRQVWTELGGRLDGKVREAAAPEGSRVLASHQAPPLAEWLRGAMKRSDNPLTRLAFLQLGSVHAQAAQFPSTRAAADAQVRDWLRAHGIADAGLVTDNGSGLSRSERLSPALLAAAIQVALTKPYAPELVAGLPLAGVDGTLSRRLRGTAAEANGRLKTGTLRDAVGLAGTLKDARGRLWVVAAHVNHDQAARKGRPVLDALMAHLAASQ
ncbi:D-alanyl-D-alanine carboxypeptidase/D-alanyl-D-alanine-endopeptidase [Inhella sp.]|uniref:D-alanyl-D-alanine carboxypeptidase/D-alanyl-D-alanine endopeptidase n=1 Tax=Inhella sp. TaxID=1921806 RepID=UPI0035B1D19F